MFNHIGGTMEDLDLLKIAAKKVDRKQFIDADINERERLKQREDSISKRAGVLVDAILTNLGASLKYNKSDDSYTRYEGESFTDCTLSGGIDFTYEDISADQTLKKARKYIVAEMPLFIASDDIDFRMTVPDHTYLKRRITIGCLDTDYAIESGRITPKGEHYPNASVEMITQLFLAPGDKDGRLGLEDGSINDKYKDLEPIVERLYQSRHIIFSNDKYVSENITKTSATISPYSGHVSEDDLYDSFDRALQEMTFEFLR